VLVDVKLNNCTCLRSLKAFVLISRAHSQLFRFTVMYVARFPILHTKIMISEYYVSSQWLSVE
jgi:hypothetical protein